MYVPDAWSDTEGKKSSIEVANCSAGRCLAPRHRDGDSLYRRGHVELGPVAPIHVPGQFHNLFLGAKHRPAEQFATPIDDFFRSVSLQASGTYMNGYMVVDTKTGEIGSVEMSYKNFAFFKPDGKGGVAVTTKPQGLNTAYDHEMVQPDYMIGINYPASLLIREELKSVDNRPARRRQFLARIGGVKDIESAKALITYIATRRTRFPSTAAGIWAMATHPHPRRSPTARRMPKRSRPT